MTGNILGHYPFLLHMNRCHIPVVIMGETGCGKTRLIKFMCQLLAAKKPHDSDEEIKNMIIMKVWKLQDKY